MSSTTQVTTMSETNRAWLAAVLDCEGWIGMSWGNRPHGKVYWPRLGVGNTDYRLIERLIQITPNERCKEQWHWKADKRDDVERILLAVLPYLVIKREQALAILSLPEKNAKDPIARRNVHDICRRLNAKGPRSA